MHNLEVYLYEVQRESEKWRRGGRCMSFPVGRAEERAQLRDRRTRNIHTLCENVRPEAYMPIHSSPSTDLNDMEAMDTHRHR